MTTVDRQRWIEQRIRFLGSVLDEGVSDERRVAIETEIEQLKKEGGHSHRWLRRLFGLPRWR